MYSAAAGVVLPFGEHKGSGLALVCELLAGALSVRQRHHPNAAERGIINGMLASSSIPTGFPRDSMMAEIDAMIPGEIGGACRPGSPGPDRR